MQREIKFILPLNNNEGKSLSELHDQLKTELINNYYGFTSKFGAGGYKSQNMEIVECVVIYTLAIEKTQEGGVIEMLNFYKIEAEQEAIYYVNYEGFVQFI